MITAEVVTNNNMNQETEDRINKGRHYNKDNSMEGLLTKKD